VAHRVPVDLVVWEAVLQGPQAKQGRREVAILRRDQAAQRPEFQAVPVVTQQVE
jgi:hypothetical protein